MSARKPRPKPVLSQEARAAMMALDAQIAAEDAQDFRRELRRIKAGLPEPPREPLRTFAEWAEYGAMTHDLA